MNVSSRMWELAGLDSSRRELATLADEPLLDQLLAMCLSLREGGAERWRPLAEAAGLPLPEVVASPFGLRAVALAVETGATSVHREVRALLPWPTPLPVDDPRHGSWVGGNLRVGKYQAFHADGALATFDPAHISKWGPHELMHRAVGFHHRVDLTRWEHYLGARLNELLPVVLWYGPDQVARLDEGDFDRELAGESPRAELGRALWLTEPEPALRTRLAAGVPRLRRGLEHFARELAAIDEELATGRRVSTVHRFGSARLDPSSDAIAYVVGHHERLVRGELSDVLVPHTAALAAHGCPVRHEDLGGYRDHVVARFDALLFGQLQIDPTRAAERRELRVRWDLAVRSLRAVVCDDEHERSPEQRAARQGLLAGGTDDLHSIDCDQLRHGFEATLPATFRALSEGQLLAFLGSPEFLQRGPLDRRVVDYLTAGEDLPLAGLAAFESALVHAVPDDVVESLSEGLDEFPTDGFYFRAARFAHLITRGDVARVHPELLAHPIARPWPDEDVEHHYLIGLAPIVDDVGLAETHEVAVLPASPPLVDLWERLAAGALPVHEVDAFLVDAYGEDGAGAYLEALLGSGALGWRPR